MMDLDFQPIMPWTQRTRAKVLSVAADMDAADADEIFGLRPVWHGPEQIVEQIATCIIWQTMLEGFIAVRRDTERPVAVAFACRSTTPAVADLAFFGRANEKRAMVAVYAELERRKAGFGERHGMVLGQVAVASEHHAAQARLRRLGGKLAFSYGPIGTGGQSYDHMIWRV